MLDALARPLGRHPDQRRRRRTTRSTWRPTSRRGRSTRRSPTGCRPTSTCGSAGRSAPSTGRSRGGPRPGGPGGRCRTSLASVEGMQALFETVFAPAIGEDACAAGPQRLRRASPAPRQRRGADRRRGGDAAGADPRRGAAGRAEAGADRGGEPRRPGGRGDERVQRDGRRLRWRRAHGGGSCAGRRGSGPPRWCRGSAGRRPGGRATWRRRGCRDQSYWLLGLTEAGDETFRLRLPDRGHAAAAHPSRPEAVAFARRPGTFALVIDCAEGREVARLHSPEDRHFYGHGAFTPDGGLLFTTENAIADGTGRLGIWDARDGYRRIGEISSGGTGPHEVRLMPDGRAAGGGERRHRDRPDLGAGRAQPRDDALEPRLCRRRLGRGGRRRWRSTRGCG